MNFFIITDTVPQEGLKQSLVFANMMETTKSHHKIGTKVNITQRFWPLGTSGTQNLFGLENL